MAQSAFGSQTLPTTNNLASGSGDPDNGAILTAIQNLSRMIQTGTAVPTAAQTTAAIYLRTGGNSITSVYYNPAGNTWSAITVPGLG